MASRPDFTENSDAPLGSDELARDRASPATADQGDDALDKDDDTGLPASESDLLDDPEDDLLDDEDTVVQESLTRLPPG